MKIHFSNFKQKHFASKQLWWIWCAPSLRENNLDLTVTKWSKNPYQANKYSIWEQRNQIAELTNTYEARLVVKLFTQYQGVNYSQTFSPVVKLSTIQSVVRIADSEKMF